MFGFRDTRRPTLHFYVLLGAFIPSNSRCVPTNLPEYSLESLLLSCCYCIFDCCCSSSNINTAEKKSRENLLKVFGNMCILTVRILIYNRIEHLFHDLFMDLFLVRFLTRTLFFSINTCPHPEYGSWSNSFFFKKERRTDKLMHSFFVVFLISFNFVVFILYNVHHARPEQNKKTESCIDAMSTHAYT